MYRMIAVGFIWFLSVSVSGDTLSCRLFYGYRIKPMEHLTQACPAGYCDTNVTTIAAELVERGIPKSEIRFLMLFPKNMDHNLFPQANVDKTFKEWIFHAVVQVGRNIVDFDHYGRGVPLEMDKYFSQMFGEDNISFDKMEVRSFAYDEYLKSYQDYGHWHAHIYNRSLDSLVGQSLTDYLFSFQYDAKQVQKNITNKIKPNGEFERFILTERRLKRFKINDSIEFQYYRKRGGRPSKESTQGRIERLNPRSVTIVDDHGQTIEIPFLVMDSDSIKRLKN